MTTKKWERMAKLYKQFATGYDCDFSDDAKQAMFEYESRGIGDLSIGVFNSGKPNGYAVGKHWLNVTVASWLQDLGNTLWLPELYNGDFPIWWLDEIFKNYTDENGIFHYSWLPGFKLKNEV